MTEEPKDDIDCPDVSPLEFNSNCLANREAMNDPNKLVHPDSSSMVKYCLGTRMQMQKGKASHKLKTCLFHDVNLSKEGRFLRTMTQEAMNVSLHVNLSTNSSVSLPLRPTSKSNLFPLFFYRFL